MCELNGSRFVLTLVQMTRFAEFGFQEGLKLAYFRPISTKFLEKVFRFRSQIQQSCLEFLGQWQYFFMVQQVTYTTIKLQIMKIELWDNILKFLFSLFKSKQSSNLSSWTILNNMERRIIKSRSKSFLWYTEYSATLMIGVDTIVV